jgi:hypothetical protein
VAVLALKLILAPAFVVAASLTARRFGPRVGGLVGGLPVVAGPILLVLAIVHDARFAQRSATTSLLGLVSLSAFVVAYGYACRRTTWPGALAVAWLAFLAVTALASLVHAGPTVALACACVGFVAARAALPVAEAGEMTGAARARSARLAGTLTGKHPVDVPARRVAPAATTTTTSATTSPPSWDLPVRAACAAVMVLAITGASAGLGPRLSGLLAPSPIITTVLAAFTHAQLGSTATLRLLRGMLLGFYAFALFSWTIATALPHTSIAAAFALGTLVAVLTQLAIMGGEFVQSRA